LPKSADLSTLDGALDASGLDETLNDEDATFTVFAPTNGAFRNIDSGELADNSELTSEVLEYHVVSGQAIEAGDIEDGQTVETVDGETLEFSVDGETVQVNGATVTLADAQASNGVVHVIDGVLLETVDAVDRAILTPNFSILADLVAQANLDDDLSNEDGTLTVFAPTDDAFLAALDENDNGEIDDDEVPSNAADLLQYHVANSVFYASDEPTAPSGTMIPGGDTDVGTLEGSNILVRRDGSSVTLNPENEASSAAAPDVDVTNGVIHGIDTVLSIPPSN
jgi:Secreted and surface protein containing fasciclin-like repeats